MRIVTLALLLVACSAAAQEGAYYADLRAELQTAYGIAGGEWLLPPTEAATLASAFATTGVATETFVVTGQPFEQGLRITTTDRPTNFWERSVHFTTPQPVSSGDALLVVAWIRGVSGERGFGFFNHAYELAEAPFSNQYSRREAPTSDWRRVMIPFEATDALPRSWYKLHLGFQAQTIEIGGVAVLHYGTAYSADDLPRTAHHREYDGRDASAPWRAEAQSRIETHRKSDLVVRVVDTEGQPVEGAAVDLVMQRHAFGFGTAITMPERTSHHYGTGPGDLETYYGRFEDLTGDGRGFNWAVFEDEMRWKVWEEPYWPPFTAPETRAQTLDFFEWLMERGIIVRGHILVWPGFEWLPADLEANQGNPAYIRQRIGDHIAAMVGHPDLQGRVTDWNVLNEPAHLDDLENVFGGVEEYALWFQQAAAADPTARLWVNEYDLLSSAGMNISVQERYAEIIEAIEANGGRVDGIGLEAHVSYPLASPMLMYEIMEEYAAIGGGKRLSISEYDAVGVDEDVAADYMRDVLTLAFSHPAMDSFLMWGYWDDNHWRDDAPLYDDEWNLKPSGQAFVDLVFGEWWTDESAISGADGSVSTRGFLGDYEVSVTLDGASASEPITLLPGGTTVEVTLDLAGTSNEEGPDGGRLVLDPVRPNPARSAPLVRYYLHSAEQVKLTLHDVLGRELTTTTPELQSPGWHERELDVSGLAPGVYVVRVSAGDETASRTLSIAR